MNDWVKETKSSKLSVVSVLIIEGTRHISLKARSNHLGSFLPNLSFNYCNKLSKLSITGMVKVL